MAKRFKYRLNKAKRRELEALKKLSGTQDESRQLRNKLKILEDMLRNEKEIAGYTCIRIGREPQHRGEVIGCSVMIRADELLYGIRGTREVVNVTTLIRQHTMALARELENGILGYMRKEGML